MKIHSRELKAAIAAVTPVLPSRSNIPALQSVLVSKNTVTAYNLETGIIAKMDVYADAPFLLPPKAVDLMSKLPDGDVFIETGETLHKIKCGDIVASYAAEPPEDYPYIDLDEKTTSPTIINGDWFRSAIRATNYAVAITDEKPALKGVLIDCRAGFFNMVCCDTRRLAWSKIEHDGEFQFIVMPEALKPLLALKGDINIRHSRSKAIFECDNISIVARLLTGEHVPYAQFASKELPHIMMISRERLLESLDRISLLTDEKKRQLVVLQVEKGLLSLVVNEAAANYDEKIQAEGTEPLRIGFNRNLLRDAVKSFSGEKLQISYSANKDMIKIISESNAGLLALVVPVLMR